MRRSENSSPVANGRIHPTATVSAAILPIKSSPCSLRSARSTSQGSKRRLQTGTDRVWSTGCRPGDGITSGIAEATGSVRSQDAESSVNIYAHGATSGAEAFLTQAGALVQPELGMPGIADARGGVILRLSPSERSLDPWDTLFAPLRAMCDIEPSLSRAGMEYRGVISAVEGVHEIKTHDQTKVRKCLLEFLPAPRRRRKFCDASRRKHAVNNMRYALKQVWLVLLCITLRPYPSVFTPGESCAAAGGAPYPFSTPAGHVDGIHSLLNINRSSTCCVRCLPFPRDVLSFVSFCRHEMYLMCGIAKARPRRKITARSRCPTTYERATTAHRRNCSGAGRDEGHHSA